MTDKKRTLTPDRSQLEHWRDDPVTRWIMDKVGAQFRPWPRSRLVKPEELAQFNQTSGSQQILEAIEKLVGDGV